MVIFIDPMIETSLCMIQISLMHHRIDQKGKL